MSKVWICEYPYPTMREDGPSEECDGCPIWEEQQREARAAESRSQTGAPVLHLVRPAAAR